MEKTNGNSSNERMDRVERALERLTERHEALAQSMELAQHDWNERFKRTTDEWNERSKRTTAMVERVVGTVEQLTVIVKSHELRLSNLEGGAA